MRTTKINTPKKQGRLALASDGFYYPISDLRVCCVSNEVMHINDLKFYLTKDGAEYYKPSYTIQHYVNVYAYKSLFYLERDLEDMDFVRIVSYSSSYEWAKKEDCVKDVNGNYILSGESRRLRYNNDGEMSTGYFFRNVSFIELNGYSYKESDKDFFNIVFCVDTCTHEYEDNCYYDSYNNNYTKNPIYTFNYHAISNVMSDNCSNSSRYKIGYEIEKEDEDILKSVTASEMFEKTKWIKERDGSLDDDRGYELKSPIFSLDKGYIFDSINSSQLLTSHINAKSSHRCGGHINISETGLTSRELYNKIEFFNRLVEALYYPRVTSNDYAMMKEEYDCYKDSICIKSYALEFRSFNRVRNVQQLEYRTDLIQYGLNNDFCTATNAKRLFENCEVLNGILENMYASSKGFQKDVIRSRYAQIFERFYHLDYDNISI